ncbi:MAG: heavy metal translocating P-type ATPase [Sphingobacteriaceae bacterium]
MFAETQTAQKHSCYHCGDSCNSDTIKHEEKVFCCDGCKMVYEIINDKGLCDYYDIEKNPGLSQKIKVREGKFAFLEDETVKSKLIHFSEGVQNHVTFYLPQMHCSSCVWLLEHLNKLNGGIIKSQVNFLKKEVTVVFESDKVSLKKIAELLTSVGYEPHISLNNISTKSLKKYNKAKIYKIGIAGFCFGNIMMLSFPEYFSFGYLEDEQLKRFFSYLNLFLALPVFFYSASDFFISSYKSLKQKFLNIDAPIALAVVITFSRSVFEILTNSGAGYLDSMSGIVFFMLVGRYFQDLTYETLSFERDYKSYFPLGVSVIQDDHSEKQIPVSKLKVGDRIKIHHGEIIPADCILFLGKASIDYSFVTGESLPTEKTIGEIVYAGGKQTEGAIELEVIKEVSQSYLTQLWNNDVFKEDVEEKKTSFIHGLSKYFTYVLFSIAIITGIYWKINNPSNVLNSITAILIVACPCALLLSATFTNGNILRYLGRSKFYAKNANAVERIADADTIVFDKTGTITYQQEAKLIYQGDLLTETEQSYIKSLASQSNHPLSKAIVASLQTFKPLKITDYSELKGKGISGKINGVEIKLGSANYVGTLADKEQADGSLVYVSINEQIKGCFIIKNKYRSGLTSLIPRLQKMHKVYIVSGDNESDKENLQKIFGRDTTMLFNQKPEDKLEFIRSLQSQNKKVIMLGDGLNDAGALKQSDVGIAITDDMNNFSPACDAILNGSNFNKLSEIIQYCKDDKKVIIGSFIISIIYNIVGLYFAVQGDLSPVIAAILMPISSISIVLFTSISAWVFSLKLKNQKTDKSHVLT